MYIREKAYNNAIQKVKIQFGKIVGCENDEEAYIILKELPTLETMELKEAHEQGEIAMMNYFHKILPKIFVDHNLYETEEKKMTNEAVADFVFEKLDLTSKIISEYCDAVFTSRKNPKDDK